MTNETTEATDQPAFMTRARMVRWAAVLTVGILVVLAVWQSPSYALRGWL
jgi:hypothetical protein